MEKKSTAKVAVVGDNVSNKMSSQYRKYQKFWYKHRGKCDCAMASWTSIDNVVCARIGLKFHPNGRHGKA